MIYTALLPMDRLALQHLVEVGGSSPSVAIPARLFAGDRPEGLPNMVELGLIKHVGTDEIAITQIGREALACGGWLCRIDTACLDVTSCNRHRKCMYLGCPSFSQPEK
jgi:hypothetical protein